MIFLKKKGDSQMYYEIIAKERVKDMLREIENRRLIKAAKNARRREYHPMRTKLLCKFGLISVC